MNGRKIFFLAVDTVRKKRPFMPEIRLTLLVGGYAQRRYLGAPRGQTLTESVRNFATSPPRVFPLPHPSWRSGGWMTRNPWFERDVLPALRAAINAIL